MFCANIVVHTVFALVGLSMGVVVPVVASFAFFLLFFFFKQKTAYEMRISDWSSDVCSSDLLAIARQARQLGLDVMVGNMMGTSLSMAPSFQIGRASCRERVCQYV